MIESLQQLTRLSYLDLGNTRVEGNIESLYKLTALFHFNLETPTSLAIWQA